MTIRKIFAYIILFSFGVLAILVAVNLWSITPDIIKGWIIGLLVGTLLAFPIVGILR